MFNYEELAQLAGTWFADVVRDRIRSQEEVRTILHYSVEKDGEDISVNVLTGWNGKPHSLWVFAHNPEWGNEISVAVVNAEQVAAFNQFVKRAQQ
ncbi:hypothetical protein [Cohnella sp. GbtcB17]|uniref:hypothetical protein n=1 Tax=Cohnella sp. GbtcB17 TaxID=2824762 RepID=UPI001C306387|nr:hypothetical protein [Cohnella sp. GbtcB17]